MAHCWRAVTWIAIVLGVVWHPAITRAATRDEVQAAIDKGKQYLYKQLKQGNWESARKRTNRNVSAAAQDQPGGLTATALYALLSAGEDPNSDKLAPAVHYLETTDLTGTYAVGMRCQVWRLLPQTDQVKAALRRDAAALQKGLQGASGMYDAQVNGTGDDHRFSQYGVQGMWACAEAGREVPTSYWQAVADGWSSIQMSDGAWNYTKPPIDKFQTLPMTAAGVATLFMTQDELSMGTSPACNGNVSDPHIDKGMDYLARHFDNILHSRYRYYALWGIEETGAASGRKYLGSTNWYERGADYLVSSQRDDGSWGDVPDTAFGILFLVRGRAPVAMNKLQYQLTIDGQTQDGNWNQRPRDVANFDKWMSKQVEEDRLINWQVVTLDAPVEELHDAPILFIAGNQTLALDPQQKEKLRTFVEQGGMILFNADCGTVDYSDSVKKLAAELFPLFGEFRELPPDHPIFKNEQFLRDDWTEPLTVLGVSNGVRELMILIPKADLSRAWQGQMTATKSSLFELGADILLYATDKTNIREKGETFIVEPDPKITDTRSLTVGRLKYDGIWDPEPGGWRRLAAIMHNTYKVDLNVQPISIGASTNLEQFKVIDITGSGHFKLDDTDWIQLKAYVENGGTLIVDAAGGSATFADDVRTQLLSTFPDASGQLDQPLRLAHPLYTQFGQPLDSVAYRTFARHALVENLKLPRIKGIKVAGDRIGVFFSAEDISAGLVGEPVDGILGYEPDSATTLMEKMLLYAQSGGSPVPPPTTEPAATQPTAQ
jgi:hypothetical protein